MATRKMEVVIKAKDAYSTTMKNAGKAMKQFGGIAKTVFKAGAIAVAGFVTALVAMTKSTATAGDAFQKMSLRTGMSTEALSELKHVAEISGASIETFEKGVKTLAKRISDASFGLETYQRIFRNLGVQYKTTSGELREVDAVFMDAVEAINLLGSETEKSAMAQELFGRAGTQMLPMMKAGKEGITALREEAQRLGITFSQLEADQSAEFNDTLLRLQRTFTGIKNTLGKDLIPVMTSAMKSLSESIQENRDWLVRFTKEGIVSLVGGLGSAIEVMRFFHNGWLGLKLVGNATAVILSDALRIVFESLRLVLTPLDLLFDGLVMLGKMDVNPLDSMEDALGSFQVTSREVLSDVVAETEAVNGAYDVAKVAVEGYEESIKNLLFAEKEVKEQRIADAQEVTEVVVRELDLQGIAKRASILDKDAPELKRAGGESEFGAEIIAMQENYDALVEHHNNKIAFLTEIGAHEVDIHRATVEAQVALDEQLKQKRVATATATVGALASVAESLSTMMGGKSKAMLKIVQGTAIAQAVVQGYSSAVSAWEKGMTAGGPPLALAFTTASLLKTGALITKMGGSQGGDVGSSVLPANATGTGSSFLEPAQQAPTQEIHFTFINPIEGDEFWRKATEENIIPLIEDLGINANITTGMG